MKNNAVKIGIGLLSILAVVIIVFAYGTNQKIKGGVRIEGISFSGHTKEGAYHKLSQMYLDKLNNSRIILSHEEKTWEIPFDAIDAKYDTISAVDNAFNAGRNRNMLDNFFNSVGMMFKGYNVQVPISYNKNVLRNRIKVIAKEVNKSAVNAKIKIKKGKNITVIPEQLGVRLDIEQTLKLVEDRITSSSNEAVVLPVQQNLPKYRAEVLRNIDAEIGVGQTYFNSGETNRSQNIRNALKRINGTILLPGEDFSLNSVLGPRNADNGYKSAPVISNDELVPGMGGGVCQVATTLYNAVLNACLEVTQRQHHTFPPAYVPIGQDATIAGDYIDFKFKNNTGYPVFVYAEALGSRMVIKVFSKKLYQDRRIKIESQVLDVEDPGPDEIVQDSSIPSGVTKVGRTARKGYRVTVYRSIYNGSRLIGRQLISNDYYKPIRGIVKIGTGPVELDQGVINQYELLPDFTERSIEEPDNPPDVEQNLYNFY